MNYESFKEYFWEYIPQRLISDDELYFSRTDYCDEILYHCYRTYEYGNISENTICKLAVELIRLTRKEFEK